MQTLYISDGFGFKDVDGATVVQAKEFLLQNLKWQKTEKDEWVAKMSSILNFPKSQIFPQEYWHFFLEEMNISRVYSKKPSCVRYVVSSTDHDPDEMVRCAGQTNVFNTLNEAKRFAQEFALDWYDLEYGCSFKID